MSKKITDAYFNLLQQNIIRYSYEQLLVIEQLQAFDNRIGLFSKWQGLYLYGEVGRGKSLLVDLYFKYSKIKKKQRLHFHSFMQEVHRQLRLFKDKRDPILLIGKGWGQRVKLLFLDELHIHDIGNAMILSRLFTSLLANKVFVVITSNYHPDELYEDGLQRENFLPTIELIKKKMQIIKIGGEIDYRLTDQSLSQYYINDKLKLEKIFLEKSKGKFVVSRELQVNGRILYLKKTVDHIAWCTFSELCLTPLGAADYQVLVKYFSIIFISEIPCITDINAMKRFIILIDELYENKIQLFCSAALSPEKLCLHPEFKRIASRLIEMCK